MVMQTVRKTMIFLDGKVFQGRQEACLVFCVTGIDETDLLLIDMKGKNIDDDWRRGCCGCGQFAKEEIPGVLNWYSICVVILYLPVMTSSF